MAPAAQMSHPRDLRIEDVAGAFVELAEHLTEEGKNALVRDLMQSLTLAQRLDSVKPVQETVEAWYRTLVAVSHDDYHEAMQEDLADDRPLTVEELREQLRLAS